MCPASAQKDLWIIAVLFAAIGVASAPKANADSITDRTPHHHFHIQLL